MVGGIRGRKGLRVCGTSFFFFCLLCRMQDVSSLTRDQTWAPCIGSAGSSPLDYQGRPNKLFFSRMK